MRRWICVLAVFVVCAAASPAMADATIPLEGLVPDAGAGFVTAYGFDFISDIASQLLGELDLSGLIFGLNPLFEVEDCALIFKGVANITDFSLETWDIQIATMPIMGLYPVENALYAQIAVSPAAGEDLITLGVDGYWGLGCTEAFNATAALNATPLTIGASLTVDYAPGAKGFVVTVHQVLFDDSNLTVTFTGLPDPSLGPLLEALVMEMLPDLIEMLGPELINEAIADLLGDIQLEGETTFGDYTMIYAFDPDFATSAEGFSIITDGRLYLEGTTFDACLDPSYGNGSPYTTGPLPTFGVLTPGGDPYDIAFALSDDILNQLLYSFIAKGELCLMFPFDFDQSLTLADLNGLVPDWQIDPRVEFAANMIDLYPSDLPRFVVGQGETDLALVAQPYRLDWYIEKDQRYVVMLTAEIDLELGLDLSVDEDNNLIITLGDSQVLFDVFGSELNILPPALIETLLNGLINNFLLPLIGGLFPPIPLPMLQGYQLVLHELGAIGADEDYFGLYCELAEPTALARPRAGFALPAFGVVMHRRLSTADSVAAGLSGTTTPTLTLATPGHVAADHYRVRVDGGIWRTLRGDTIDLSFVLDGRHVIEALAVSRDGLPSSRPAWLSFVVDRVAPRIDRVEMTPTTLVVRAHDYQAPTPFLRYQYRVGSGPWSRWQTSSRFTLPSPLAPSMTVQVRAADPSGNVSAPFHGLTR